MHQPEVDWSTTVEVADWITQSLHPFEAHDVGSVLPSSFPAYARILHPASRRIVHLASLLAAKPELKLRWVEVAAQNGRTVHPQVQFEMISQESSAVAEPERGTLPCDEVLVLIELLGECTTTPDACWFCIWDGYGWFSEGGTVMLSGEDSNGTATSSIVPEGVLTGPRVHLPQRDYLLYGGPITAGTALGRDPWYQTPNLWWPEDRAWCVASEIDLPCTYVGGDAQLIERLVGDSRLEVLPAHLTDGVTVDSDTVNT